MAWPTGPIHSLADARARRGRTSCSWAALRSASSAQDGMPHVDVALKPVRVGGAQVRGGRAQHSRVCTRAVCYARMSKSRSRRPCSRCGPAGGRTQRGRGPPPGRRSSSCSRRGTCAWGVGWHRSSRRHSHRPHSRTPALATPRASRAHARPGPDQARTL